MLSKGDDRAFTLQKHRYCGVITMLLPSNIIAFTSQKLCYCKLLIINLLQRCYVSSASGRKNRTIFE